MNTINTLSRFVISAFLLLLTTQAFAARPVVTAIERDGNNIIVTLDQAIKPLAQPPFPANNSIYIKLYTGTDHEASTKYYLGLESVADGRSNIIAISPDTNGFSKKWQWNETAIIEAMEADKINSIGIFIGFFGGSFKNEKIETPRDYIGNNALKIALNLGITSDATITANEGTRKTHTLVASDDTATFSILENPSNLFSLSGTNNNTLTFNGSTTDFETTPNTYTVKVKASTGTGDDKNAEQVITLTLNNVDEATTGVNITGGGKTSINKTVTLTANAFDPDTALTYVWTAPTGITLSATDTKTVTFDTTAAMEGEEFTFKVAVNGIEATTTVTVNNAEIIATAVRKESKAATKVLLSRVSKTVMGRLSHLRQKQNQQSSFTNGFVNGIQINFANSNLGTAFNQVLNANGMSSTIPTPNHKINRWDTWTSAKIIIGESNGTGTNKTEFNLKSINVGLDRRIDKTKTIGFALGLDKEDRSATGTDFTGDVDTTQYTLSSYGALELNQHTAIEAVLGIAKGTHKVNSATTSDNQNSNGYFASVAYRGNMQKGKLGLSPYARYDISRIKMKATDALTNSETTTDEALAIGVDINHTSDYEDGNLTRFANLEYKSDIRREGTTYISQNAEQEVSLKLGITYQKGDTNTTINYQRTQSTNNKAHSNGIEGTLRWKF